MALFTRGMTRDSKPTALATAVPAWAQEQQGSYARLRKKSQRIVSPPNASTLAKALLRVGEAAAFLQVSNKTVRRLLARGDLKAVRIGRLLRIPSSEIDRLIADGGARGGDFGEGGSGV